MVKTRPRPAVTGVASADRVLTVLTAFKMGDTALELAELAARTDAALVQRIGHTAVLYRPSKDKRHIVLPRA